MQFNYLETPRFLLRETTPEVYHYVFTTYSKEQIMAFFGHRSQEEFKLDEYRFQNGLRTFNKTFLYFYIIDKQTNIVVGWCGFHTWYLDHRRAEIGYMLFDDQHKQKGIMSEAIAPIIDFGFREMLLLRIEALIGPTNIPSLKIIEKLKFTKEGHLRAHYCKNNQMDDSLVFSLLKHEYDDNLQRNS